MRFILIILLISLASLSGTANNLDFPTADMLTYRYYQEKKWDSVIMIGKQALRQDIDFYYLRVRLGIAYFEKQEYPLYEILKLYTAPYFLHKMI